MHRDTVSKCLDSLVQLGMLLGTPRDDDSSEFRVTKSFRPVEMDNPPEWKRGRPRKNLRDGVGKVYMENLRTASKNLRMR